MFSVRKIYYLKLELDLIGLGFFSKFSDYTFNLQTPLAIIWLPFSNKDSFYKYYDLIQQQNDPS